MITFTENAKTYLSNLVPEDHVLRVSVIGGGCSGLSYNMEFIPSIEGNGEDEVLDFGLFTAIVDPKSALYLQGAEIDYSDGLNGQGFIFKNPGAKRSCGCGKSFCQ